jgi:hypothetical protein
MATTPATDTQLTFDGMPVRAHHLSLTGQVEIDAADYTLGQPIDLQISGVVTGHTHRLQRDPDTDEEFVEHRVTVRLDNVS